MAKTLELNFIAPSRQKFTATGTYYPTFAFTCSVFTVSPTVGATYTNNAVTFTVSQVIANVLYATASGVPAAAFGTLTKASGTGDSSVTFNGYYNPKKIKVLLTGGGGGGAGSGSGGGGTGGTASSTSFGGFITAGAGVGGQSGGGGTVSNANSISLPAIAIVDASGTLGTTAQGDSNAASQYIKGGQGASNIFGGAAYGGVNVAVPIPTANTGAGGGGAGWWSTGGIAGGGGTSGGYVEALVNNPNAGSYSITIGGGGTGGSAGAGSVPIAGGAGASGLLIVEEYFNY